MAVAAARRSSDRDEHRLGALHPVGQVGRERQPSALGIRLDQRLQTRLPDRHPAGIEPVDLVLVLVDAADSMTEVGKTRAGDEPHIAGADHRDTHAYSQLLKWRALAAVSSQGQCVVNCCRIAHCVNQPGFAVEECTGLERRILTRNEALGVKIAVILDNSFVNYLGGSAWNHQGDLVPIDGAREDHIRVNNDRNATEPERLVDPKTVILTAPWTQNIGHSPEVVGEGIPFRRGAVEPARIA